MSEPVCFLASGTAVPEGIFSLEIFKKLQTQAANFAISKLDPEKDKERIKNIKKNLEWVIKCADHSSIEKRHGIVPEHGKSLTEYYKMFDYNPPYTLRAKYWRKYCPGLAMNAVKKALKKWGGDVKTITHVVSHSTTGWDVPGLSHHIIFNLELPESARAVCVNFVGCQGGTSVLYVADMIAKQNPNAVVLCVAAEIQSPLGRMYNDKISLDRSIYMPNVLFGDAAACAIIGRPKDEYNKDLVPFEILDQGAHYIPNTRHVLTIAVSEESGLYYENSIKKELPVHLNSAMSKNFAKWKNSVLPKLNFNDCAYAVHPGGLKLLDNFVKLIEDYGVKNGKKECQYSYYNLAKYGNLASAAIIFILGDVIQNTKKDHIYFMAMGPGVCLEYGGMRRYKKGEKSRRKGNQNNGNSFGWFYILIIAALVAFILSGKNLNDFL